MYTFLIKYILKLKDNFHPSSFANASRYTFSDDCFSCTFPRQVEATACSFHGGN